MEEQYMYQKSKNKQELIRAISRPNVKFIDERPVFSEKSLNEAVKDFQRMVRAGRQITLVAFEPKQ
jgi:hypothetical protein